jgi:sarcosine oxidase subunit delta
MKILNCPLNGPRNISEFTYGGEYQEMPDHQSTSSEGWAEYIFFHDNNLGEVLEWWCHTPTSYWFLAQRNTLTDEVICTFPPSQLAQFLGERS